MKINVIGVLSVVIYELSLHVSFVSGKHQIEKEKHVRTLDIEAVEGRSVSLPCPLSAPLDDVNMVLWFRDNAGIPLYSFDFRSKSSTHARHWSAPEVFGSRAKFNFESPPASLDIKDIKRHDQGVYRCRIDFRTSQTQSFRYNLSVIILPEQPIVLDRWGRQLNGTVLGPKQEGDDIMISCRVVGGRPQPEVRWLVNGLLVDDQYDQNSGDVIENRLLWPSIQRTDLNSVFTCQAMNTLLVEPKESRFIMDMYLKPLEVKITNPPNPLVADRRYEISCESIGSRPNAIITWYKGKRQLRRTKDDVFNNTTRSELSFVPSTEDDGKSITCRAENPNVNGLFLETSWKLDVVYPPMVSLRLGSTLSADDIKEGDDVYFECHVQANPQWRKLLWLHDGAYLAHNTSARVIRSNQSLVLQKVTRFSAGNYACSAINEEGETVSNQLPLRVKYTPICLTDKIIIVGAAKDENVEIICQIHADPPARTFRWKFNNSGETLDVGSERYSVNGTRSVLRYTPVTDQDYGTLSCWGINEVGTQTQPCIFQVVLAGLPGAVSNCTMYNQTQMSIEVQCIAGYDGGLPQVFILELYSAKATSTMSRTRFNFTNTEEPYFLLDTLESLTSMMAIENNSLRAIVYSINQKGRSPSVSIPNLIIGDRSKHRDVPISIQLSPILIGAVITILIICISIIIRLCFVICIKNVSNVSTSSTTIDTKTPPTTQSSGNNFIYGNCNKDDTLKKNNGQKPRWQHTEIQSKTTSLVSGGGNGDGGGGDGAMTVIEDERDPDVIPPQYAADHHYGQLQWSQNSTLLKTAKMNGGSPKKSLIHTNLESHNIGDNVLTTPIITTTVTLSSSSLSSTIMTKVPSTMVTTTTSTTTGSDLDININAIRDRLMTTRVPESCV